MKRRYLPMFLAVLFFAVSVGVSAGEPTVVYLVRHAEKVDESRDPDLSDAGGERAAALAALLQHVSVDAAYCSQFKRTRQTVEPLAKANGIEPMAMDARQPAALVEAIRARAGETVVVAGHSNTVPDLVARLGGPRVTIEHSDYDNLYLLILHDDGVVFQHFHFKP